MDAAILLIAHGSRHTEANDDLRHVATAMEKRGFAVVEASFLEIADPDIDSGGIRCVQRGANRVVMVPYFLSAGIHVRRDLTSARERLRARFPSIEFRLAEPLGRHPALIDVVVDRVGEVLERPLAGPTSAASE